MLCRNAAKSTKFTPKRRLAVALLQELLGDRDIDQRRTDIASVKTIALDNEGAGIVGGGRGKQGPAGMLRLGMIPTESDHAAIAQLCDRRRLVAKRGENGVGMLALFRRRRAQLARGAAEFHRLSDQLLRPARRMVNRARDADMPYLRIGENLVDAINWAAWHTRRIQQVNPFGGLPRSRDLLDRGIEPVAIA